MFTFRLALLLCALAYSSMADDDGWNFTPMKGTKTKQDAALMATAAAFDGADQDPRVPLWWASFKEAFYKTYPNAGAEATAYANFKGNLNKILNINSDLDVPFWTSGNNYADFDYASFRQKFLMTDLNLTQLSGGRRLSENPPVTEAELHARRQLAGSSVDWRSAGKLTPVKDQGQCGSCWAYSATATIESAYLINQGLSSQQALINLSEQQLIDCVGRGSSCNGGSSDNAIRYVNEVYQTTEDLYPSTFKDGTCNAGGKPASGTAVRLSSPTNYPGTWSESKLMDAVSNQPTVIYFEVDSDFYSYSGGTYWPTSCGSSINHAMVVVGYHYTGDSSSSYWIVRNSWGAYWGDNGYVYIQMTGDGAGPCGMYQYVYQPSTQFSLTLNTGPRPSAPNRPGEPQSPSAPPGPYGPNWPDAPYSPSDASPTSPSGPSTPNSPDAPNGSPYTPDSPGTPAAPSGPDAPSGPSTPNAPWAPWSPWAPWAPFGFSQESPPSPPAPPPLKRGVASPPRLRRRVA